MTTESPQTLPNNASSSPDIPKNKESLTAIDMDDFDINNNDDDLGLPNENESIAKKMDSRRKIEIYFEKKRLQEELGESVEIDFDF